MKTATVFGSLSSNADQNFDSALNLLKQKNIKKIFIGGYYGQIKNFADKCQEHDIEAIVIITQKGKDLGYGSNEKIKEVAVEKYFDKKSFLLSSSDLFFFLPTQKIGLGLFSEIVDLLEYSVVYCNLVKKEPSCIIFMGQIYKNIVNEILTRFQTINTLACNVDYVN